MDDYDIETTMVTWASPCRIPPYPNVLWSIDRCRAKYGSPGHPQGQFQSISKPWLMVFHFFQHLKHLKSFSLRIVIHPNQETTETIETIGTFNQLTIHYQHC